MNRRDVIKTGALAAAAAMGGRMSERAAVRNDETKNMHLSLAAYSVRQALTDGRMDLFGFVDWCAELGLSGAELTSYYFPEGFDRAYLLRLKRHALSRGITVSGTAVRNNFCRPPGPDLQRDIDHVRQWIDHAGDLFAPHIRIFAGDLPAGVEKETGIQWVADAIRQVLDHAGDRGVLIGLENHGGITARVADLLAICDAVGEHPWFGINLDTANFRTNSYEELALAAPRAVNVQLKTEVYHDDGSKTPVDLPRIRDMLVEAGYKGWIALEYEAEEDAFTAVPRFLEEMRALF